MRTTKTAVCLQTKAIFHHLCGFNVMRNTLPIALTRLLEYISTINLVGKILTHMTIRMHVGSL